MDTVLCPSVYRDRLDELSHVLMVLHEVPVMALVALPDGVQAREHHADVSPSDPARRLNVLSGLAWHAVEDHGVEPVYVHAVADHARREHSVALRCIVARRLFEVLQNVRNLVGAGAASKLAYLQRAEPAVHKVAVNVAAEVGPNRVEDAPHRKVRERCEVQVYEFPPPIGARLQLPPVGIR